MVPHTPPEVIPEQSYPWPPPVCPKIQKNKIKQSIQVKPFSIYILECFFSFCSSRPNLIVYCRVRNSTEVLFTSTTSVRKPSKVIFNSTSLKDDRWYARQHFKSTIHSVSCLHIQSLRILLVLATNCLSTMTYSCYFPYLENLDMRMENIGVWV